MGRKIRRKDEITKAPSRSSATHPGDPFHQLIRANFGTAHQLRHRVGPRRSGAAQVGLGEAAERGAGGRRSRRSAWPPRPPRPPRAIYPSSGSSSPPKVKPPPSAVRGFHRRPNKRSPAGSPSDPASLTNVSIRGRRIPRSSIPTSVRCRLALNPSSSWEIPTSSRNSLRFAPKR